MAVGLARDLVRQPGNAARMQRRRSPGEARHRDVEAAPEEMDGADLAEIAGAKPLQHPVDRDARLKEAVDRVRVIGPFR